MRSSRVQRAAEANWGFAIQRVRVDRTASRIRYDDVRSVIGVLDEVIAPRADDLLLQQRLELAPPERISGHPDMAPGHRDVHAKRGDGVDAVPRPDLGAEPV